MLLDALACKNQDRAPIWLMRQAGRYMPEYRKLKEKHTLLEMFHTPELIVKVTKQPLEKIGFDAAILFSDILTVLDGLDIGYDFQEKIGPVIFNPVTDPSQLGHKDNPYEHIRQSIVALKQELSVPLLGFAGAPFTIACYLIEGQTRRDMRQTKKWLFQNPISFQTLIDRITEATIDYLKLQIEAGVDAIQLFDSWANTLAHNEFRRYSLEPMRRIVEAIDCPTILFCRGSSHFAPLLAEANPSCISIDFLGDLPQIRNEIPPHIALQGNLDPMLLYADWPTIEKQAAYLLDAMQDEPGYIFNLGHGILPDTPVENVKRLAAYVQSRTVQSPRPALH